MPLPSLKQWDEDRKTLGVVYDHSRAKPVGRKNKIKKSRQEAFKSALADRTKPSGQLQYTATNTSDSSMDHEQCGAQAKRDEAPSQRRKENHHMIQIFIKTPIINPKNLCLRLNHNTTIFSLKKIIHRKLGIRPALQNLHTGQHQFKSCEALTLLDLGIQPETNITLSLATGLLGGAPKPGRTADETFLRNLAGKLGADWQQLATKLLFTSAEIGKFKSHDENPKKQAHQMLESWWREQADDREAGKGLRNALIQIGCRELASKIPKVPKVNVGLPESSGADNMDEVHSRQSPEHQSTSSDTSGIDERTLRDLAKDIGEDWTQLATFLGFGAVQIKIFKFSHIKDLEKQAVEMFLAWTKEHPNRKEAEEELSKALVKLGRTDLVQMISDPSKRATSVKPERGNSPKADQTSFQRQSHALHGSPTPKSDGEHHSKGEKAVSEIKQHPDYAHTSRGAVDTGKVHSRESSKHQSTSSDTSGTCDKLLRDLAENIGKDWKRLATSLDFNAAKIETFELNHKNDIKESIFEMLDTFARKHTNQKEVTDRLTKAFEKLERKDMVHIIADGEWVPSNIKACGETLVSHYEYTMKVNTHPMCKDEAVDMKELFVSLELLQETNNLAQPIKLQSESIREKHSDTMANENKFPHSTLHPDFEGEYEVGKNQNKTPLKSYEDMLRLDKKRFLITAESGYGKSTLLKKIAYDWAVLKKGAQRTDQKQDSPLLKYKLVFLLEIHKMKDNFNIMDEICLHLLPPNEFKKEDIKDYITQHPDEVLILLDGADEISFDKLIKATEDFSVNNVLSFKSLKRCQAIVTSRQSTAIKLLKCNTNYTRINIVGFDDNNKQDYICKYFNNSDIKHQDHILSEINKSETLRSLSEIPLFLWLMCSSLSHSGRLPDTITELFDLAIGIFYQQKISKDCPSKPSETITKERFNKLMSKLGQVALERLMLKSDEKHFLEVSDFDTKDFDLGCEVGLLTPVKFRKGIDVCERVKFYHSTIMQYCCSVYLSDLAKTSPDKLNEYLSKLLSGDVEKNGYLIRFCSGRNQKAAEYVIELTKKQLTAYNQNTTVECERYVCLHKIMMFALFESKRTLMLDEWVRFPYELKGEDLLAAHYFIQNIPRGSRLVLDDITITCQSEYDLKLLETIMDRTVCNLSLQIVRVNMKDQLDILKNISEHLKSLTLEDCHLTCVSVPQLFKLMKSATKLKTVDLSGNNLHGLKSDQIPPTTSLKSMTLNGCKLRSDDIGSLFSLVTAAGSIQNIWLNNNNLHGIQGDQITPVSSLEGLSLSECSLQSCDVGQVFSLFAVAGSIKTVLLDKNNLHGIQGDQITPVSSLKELSLSECSLECDDIGQVFFLVAAAGNIKKVWLDKNYLHGIQGDQITRVSSLDELYLSDCSLECDDIGQVFSLVAAAGSIKTLWLKTNKLHGIQGDLITPVSSLEDLSLAECSLKCGDIGQVFSLVAAAGSIKTVWLNHNNLEGIQGDKITQAISSLEELYLLECSLQCGDIVPVFSLLAAAGSIKKVWLDKNDLNGIQGDQITSVSSLEELSLLECSLRCSDVGPVFSLVAAAGSIRTVLIDKNNLHGIQGDQITSVSSLEELSLLECSLRYSDVGPVFSLVAAAGSIKTLWIDKNNLHGIQGDQLTPVSSLEELFLSECSLQFCDIGPFFSLVAAAGSIKTVLLDENNLHGIQGDQITSVSSLEELYLSDCSLQRGDIGQVFSLVAAAGSIKKVGLNNNNLHGIQGDQITHVSSLEELYLSDCSLRCGDIGQVFSLVAVAGSIKTVWLNHNNLHGIQRDQITPVSSLEELYLSDCSLQCGDVGPVFSLVAAAGSIKKLGLSYNNLHGIQGDQITPVSCLEVLFLLNCGLNDDEKGALSSSLKMKIWL